MAGDAKKAAEAPKKGGALGLIVGGVLMIGLGGGAFYAVYAGIVPTPERHAEAKKDDRGHARAKDGHAAAPTFLPLSPILVTLGRGAEMRHLQLTAQLEVAPDRAADATALTPRVLDVLTTYLRAVDAEVIEDPAAMLRMRSQMLRRVQMVSGEGVVRDLLVSEFILR